MVFCGPCMVVYWLTANTFRFILYLGRCLVYVLTCGTQETDGAPEESGSENSFNPLAARGY
jgi:hypothetical protein